MVMAGSHAGLEIRIELLRERIVQLRERLNRENDLERIDNCIEIKILEERYRAFRRRLEALDREGDGFRTAIKSSMAQIAYDLADSFGAFVRRLDSDYRASLVQKRGSESSGAT